MSRLADALAAGRSAGRPLVIPFVTAGYPTLAATVPTVRALARAGADIVELGMPFSDPLADGPTIQRASERALANGMSLRGVLAVVEELRGGPDAITLPILLMGYCNPILRYGLEAFVADAARAGADGLIVPDLPPEEASEYRAACAAAGLAAVFLVAPNAPDDRIRLVDDLSTDFSYCVTVTGVTGARGEVQERTIAFLDRMRARARKPFVVGFGIKRPEHVRALGPHAAGVVIGSALLDAMDGAADPAEAAGALLAELRAAANETRLVPAPAGSAGGEGEDGR